MSRSFCHEQNRVRPWRERFKYVPLDPTGSIYLTLWHGGPKRGAKLDRRGEDRLALHRMGRPMHDGYVESFNGRMRDELLNETLSLSLGHARDAIVRWTDDYNTERPHSSIGYASSAAFAAGFEKQRPARVQAVASHAPMRNHNRRSLVPTGPKLGVTSRPDQQLGGRLAHPSRPGRIEAPASLVTCRRGARRLASRHAAFRPVRPWPRRRSLASKCEHLSARPQRSPSGGASRHGEIPRLLPNIVTLAFR
jgi:hypothetical protein